MKTKLLLCGALGAMAVMGAQAADPSWAQGVPDKYANMEANVINTAAKTEAGAAYIKAKSLKTSANIDQTGFRATIYYGKHDGGLMIDKQMVAFESSAPGIVAARALAKQMAANEAPGNFRSTATMADPTELAPTTPASAQVAQTDQMARFNL